MFVGYLVICRILLACTVACTVACTERALSVHWILYGTLGTQRACCTPFTPKLILQPGACIFGPDPHALKSWATSCFLIDCFPKTAQGSQMAWSYKTTLYVCSPFDAAATLNLGERGCEAVKHFVQLHTYYYLLLHSLAHNLALALEKKLHNGHFRVWGKTLAKICTKIKFEGQNKSQLQKYSGTHLRTHHSCTQRPSSPWSSDAFRTASHLLLNLIAHNLPLMLEKKNSAQRACSRLGWDFCKDIYEKSSSKSKTS